MIATRRRCGALSPTCGRARRSRPSNGQHPEATDEAVVGGIASMLGRHILAGEAERLAEFFPEIAEFALTPYVGSDEARRIISAA